MLNRPQSDTSSDNLAQEDSNGSANSDERPVRAQNRNYYAYDVNDTKCSSTRDYRY